MLILVIVVIFHKLQLFSVSKHHCTSPVAFDPYKQPRRKCGGVGVEQYSQFIDEKSEAPRCIEFNYCAHSTVSAALGGHKGHIILHAKHSKS